MNVTRDNMEIGIDSFAEAQLNNGKSYSENSAQSISDLLDRIEHADKVGLDVFGIGEHYLSLIHI